MPHTGLEVRLGGGPPGEGPVEPLGHSSPSASALDSMEELCEEMKLLAFDLQDNNRMIEG